MTSAFANAIPCETGSLETASFHLHTACFLAVLFSRMHTQYNVSQKNVPPFTCYNLDIHDPITIIFGRSVTEKVEIRWCFVFPPHLSSASALPCKTGNPEDSALVHCACNSPTSAVLSTSFILTRAPNSPELNALTTRFRKSYSRVSMSRESKRLRKSLLEFNHGWIRAMY